MGRGDLKGQELKAARGKKIEGAGGTISCVCSGKMARFNGGRACMGQEAGHLL